MQRRGLQRWARIGFAVSAWLFALGVAIQVFLAGLSTFDTPSRWADHVSFGQQIGTLTILLLIFAFVGRMPRALIAMAAAVLILYGLQFPFANTDAGSIAALHALNALVLFWLATHLGMRSRALIAETALRRI